MVEKALAQIETGEFPYHIDKTRHRRLVETVQSIQRSQIFRTDAVAIFSQSSGHTVSCCFAANRTLRQLLNHLFHRTAGNKLNDGEGNRQNSQQRGNQKEQTLKDITPHG